jgi:hypothetical protein
VMVVVEVMGMILSLGVLGVVKKNRGGRIYRVMKRLFNDYLLRYLRRNRYNHSTHYFLCINRF